PNRWCPSSWARVKRRWPSGKSLLARMSAVASPCTHSPSACVPSGESATSTAKCCSNRGVAVGTTLSGGPPHGSPHAELPHGAPALGTGSEAHLREGMLDTGLG